jgi:phosphatidylglycerophosphatase A
MIGLRETPAKLGFFSPAVLIASFGGSGLIRPASGSWGSLAGLGAGLALLHFISAETMLLAAVLAYFAGFWACTKWLAAIAADAAADKDPQAIVIDEVAGLWIALAFAPATPLGYGAAFLLFRFFDITKIWPANWADRSLPGAHGIMLDDVFAGCWAAIFLVIGRATQIL